MDVVDVVLEGSGIDEKFLGITLFTLVPNVTEFMNAISFALNGNIALSFVLFSFISKKGNSTVDHFFLFRGECIKNGDWIGLCASGVLAPDPGYGCVLGVV